MAGTVSAPFPSWPWLAKLDEKIFSLVAHRRRLHRSSPHFLLGLSRIDLVTHPFRLRTAAEAGPLLALYWKHLAPRPTPAGFRARSDARGGPVEGTMLSVGGSLRPLMRQLHCKTPPGRADA